MNLKLCSLKFLFINIKLELRFTTFSFNLDNIENRWFDMLNNASDLLPSFSNAFSSRLSHVSFSCLFFQCGIDMHVGHKLFVLFFVNLWILFLHLFYQLICIAFCHTILRFALDSFVGHMSVEWVYGVVCIIENDKG